MPKKYGVTVTTQIDKDIQVLAWMGYLNTEQPTAVVSQLVTQKIRELHASGEFGELLKRAIEEGTVRRENDGRLVKGIEQAAEDNA